MDPKLDLFIDFAQIVTFTLPLSTLIGAVIIARALRSLRA
jgi:hypothetical protein